jgi:hypothetical protein
VRYFAKINRTDMASLGGPPGVVAVSSDHGGPLIGKAYRSGDDASGEPLWSLKIGRKWVGGLWRLRGLEFLPIP